MELMWYEDLALKAILGVAILGIVYALFLIFQVLKEDKGSKEMQSVANKILIGANAYLHRQIKSILPLMLLISIALYFTAVPEHGVSSEGAIAPEVVALGRALAFLMGSSFSFLVGYIGMNIAVRGNVRVAAAAERGSFKDALRIAYRSGTVTGMLTDGLGLLGGTLIYMLFMDQAWEVLLGFGFGACLIALFMRVGGGIYTKAADVGADLVGKVEKGIPEDDPRNPAVIADLVGDNVGDCAGMAADIFESYEVTIVAAMILGYIAFGHKGVIYPLMIRAIGVFSSIVGTYFVKARDELEGALKAIFRGYALSAVISIVGFFALAYFYMNDLRMFFATLAGIVLAVAINHLTDYFTSPDKPPVQTVAKRATTGPATNILSGMSVGLESTVWALLIIVGALFFSAIIFPVDKPEQVFYGVALCGIGLLTLTGNNVSMDSFGPIVDNANGIGEMIGLKGRAREILANLDSVGNTTKAITKAIAIGSAVVAALALFWSYKSVIKSDLEITNPAIFMGFLIGGAVPFLFSSFAIKAVERGAFAMINEVRRQFREKRILEGEEEPDYARCIEISTAAAQKELVGLGALSILTPILVGFLLGVEALGGFLAGAILTGQLLAVFMANSGAAWDNAKKYIEEGNIGGKGSEAHKAAVIGDTIGDPLKDTAGPALNPLVKVINLVSVLVAPVILVLGDIYYSAISQQVPVISLIVVIVLGAVLAWVVYNSKRELKLEA